MSNPWIVLVATVLLIALSAFFVAAEFALISAKLHRLEDAAPSSRSARAALRSSSEVSILLAGSQLGITVCTLALGAITKPAVHYALTPAFEGWGMPLWVADVTGFVLALVIVTFLHLVVGEMAPKSWAIAHPERSATLLAIPMRAFMWVFRPLLRVVNETANWCLRRAGVEPVNQVSTGQNPDDLRHLVEHSINVGALDVGYSAQFSGALELQTLTVRDLVPLDNKPTAVDSDARAVDVREISLPPCRACGRPETSWPSSPTTARSSASSPSPTSSPASSRPSPPPPERVTPYETQRPAATYVFTDRSGQRRLG